MARWSGHRRQVELACAIVPDRHVDRFAENLVETIEIIAPLTAHHTGVVLRHAKATADAFADREAAEAGIESREVVPERTSPRPAPSTTNWW